MSGCKINYKNKQYTEEGFIQLLKNIEGDTVSPQLIDKLTQYISKAGISLQSLENYKENLIERGGSFDTEGVNALVDFNRGVIALESLEHYDFIEEVAHVAVEMSPDSKTMTRALELVSDTPTYKKNVEAYTKKYKEMSPNATSAQLDFKVRKEMLGKLIARNVFNSNKKDLSYRLYNALKSIWDKFVSMFNNKSLSELKTTVEALSNDMASGNFENTNVKSKESYFSLNISTSKRILEKTINRLKNRLKDLQFKAAAKKTSLTLEAKIKDLEELMSDSEYEVGLLNFIDYVAEDLETANNYISRVMDGKLKISAKQLNNLRDFIEYYTPLLNEIKRGVFTGKLFTKFPKEDIKEITRNIKKHLSEFDDINDFYTEVHSAHAEKMTQQFFDDNGLELDFDVKKSFSELPHDAWALQYWFGSLKDVSSNIGRVVYATIVKAKQKIERITTDIGRDLIDTVINKLGVKNTDVLAEKHNGKSTGYFKTPYNLGEFYKSYDSFIEGLRTKYNVPDGQREPYSLSEAVKFNKEINKWLTSNTERRYTSEYYEDLAELSVITREALLAVDIQLQQFNNKIKDDNGNVDYYTLSESDRNKLKLLQIERRKLSKKYNDDGSLKVGADAQIAEELAELAAKRKDKLKYNYKYPEFNTQRAKMKASLSEEEFKKWEEINTQTIYDDKFYELITKGERKQSKSLQEASEKRRQLLAPYRNSVGEVNVGLLPQAIQDEIKSLDRVIQMLQEKSTDKSFFKHASIETTVEYEEAMEKAKDNGTYDVWYAANHYAGYKGKMTPFSYWKHIVPVNKLYILKTPSQAWSELSKDSPYYNNNYNEEWLGMQPKTSKWGSSDYNNLSENERKALDEVLKLKQSMDNKLPISNRNAYLLPQLSKSLNDMLAKKDISLDSMKELIKDNWSSRVDDTEFGEQNMVERPDGSIGNYVPVYYTKKLESPENISTDILSSMILYAKMATNYEQMSKLAPELEVIKNEFGKVRYQKGASVKRGIETNIYKMIENFVEVQVYGKVKEKTNDVTIPIVNTKVNPTKVANNINSYIRGNNLMFNFFTIVSGYFNGFINSKIEDTVGLYTTNRAKAEANKEWVKNMGQAVSEHKSITKHNKVNVVLQHFRVLQQNQNIFDNLDKDKFLRYEKEDLVYLGYGFGDYSLKANIALAVMFNYRLYEGKFYTEANFNKLGVEAKYKDLRSVYDMYKVKDGKLVGEEVIDEHVEDYLEYTISMLSNRADGVLSETDKAKIHQSAWGQLVATHRGWLFQGLSHRWKRKGVNYMTGEVEAGSHRTFVTEFLPILKNTILDAQRTKNLKELWGMWDTLETYQKEAVLRTTLEMAAVIALIVVAKIINGISDDDDDNYALEFAAYLSNRVLLETASLSLTPTPVPYTELITVLNSPVAGTKQIETIQDITDLLWGSDEIERGPFEGFTKREKIIYKLTPGVKGLFLLRDPQSSNQFLKNKPLKYIY